MKTASAERVFGSIFIGSILGIIGYFLGQYAPFTGGLASIAEPFSDARTETAIGYAVVGGVVGAFLGLLIAPSKKED